MSRGARSSQPGERRGSIEPDPARSADSDRPDPDLPVPEPPETDRDARDAGPDPAPIVAGSVAGETVEQLKDRWLRAEADLQNYRRRARRDAEEARRDAEERVMLEMIAAIDDLERAVRAGRDAGASESWLKGVELVGDRLREYLARQGVVALEPMGKPFDPAFHEALLEIEPPPGTTPGSVVDVALRGYRRGDRVLRAARVVVARSSAASESSAHES